MVCHGGTSHTLLRFSAVREDGHGLARPLLAGSLKDMTTQPGLLAGLPFSARAAIELEFAELFEEIEDALADVRASVHSLERVLDRTLSGESA